MQIRNSKLHKNTDIDASIHECFYILQFFTLYIYDFLFVKSLNTTNQISTFPSSELEDVKNEYVTKIKLYRRD